jgi:transposase
MAKGKAYTREFKENAVRLSMSPGKSVAEVARDLGISAHTLHEWRRSMKPASHQSTTAAGSANHETLEQENRRLARELEMAREEAAILKKAIAYFAQPPKK